MGPAHSSLGGLVVMAEQNERRFSRLFEEFKAGGVTRRQFLERAAALGMSLPLAAFVANSVRPRSAAAGNGWGHKSVASLAQAAPGVAPGAGREGRTRGQGGELKLIQWQGPTLLNPHVATGTKDALAGCLVVEPLMNYLPDGSVIPRLVEEVPSFENGLLKEDLTGFTATLKSDVLWSDGTPFTTADVIFTHQWVTTPENVSVNIEFWKPIQTITAIDELTFEVTYATGNLNWYAPFTGTSIGYILPKHVLEGGAEASAAFNQAPIGT